MSNYFLNIARTTGSLLYGLKITFRHFLQARKMRKPSGVADKDYFTQKDGIVTLQYPKEEFPVPDHGRYQLHNEIEDCIVCDKCAKVCPVNCIDIEPVRATEEIGLTSDGTPKRIYAAKFDIDMSKCCFCGLCTVVCPTECLTMSNEYDFSVFELDKHNFEFGNMSEELVVEKKKEFDVYAEQKEKEKAEKAKAKASTPKPAGAKPAMGGFKPKVKPVVKEDAPEGEEKKASKPVFRPKVKPAVKDEVSDGEEKKAAKPVFRPKVKPKATDAEVKGDEGATPSKKPVFRPKIKPKKSDLPESGAKKEDEVEDNKEAKPKAAKPVFRPKIKPKNKD